MSVYIRLVSSEKPAGWSHPKVVFDPQVPRDNCDGMLAWGAPTEEFLNYQGARAWYNAEPLNHSMFRTALFRRALKEVSKSDFLHHSNPNPLYRLPCVTHYGEPTTADPADRRKGIVAIVSNFGGRVWWLRKGARMRNRFILHPSVELFGNPDGWSRFRRWPWSSPHEPGNFRGLVDGQWYLETQITALSKFSANLCLENISMPYYFTEKFVNAVRAGCIPIYHAHPTVRESFLKGAIWIDPADFKFSVSKTFSTVFDSDGRAIRENNWQWLRSDQLRQTEGYAIWSRIADIFVERILEKKLGA